MRAHLIGVIAILVVGGLGAASGSLSGSGEAWILADVVASAEATMRISFTHRPPAWVAAYVFREGILVEGGNAIAGELGASASATVLDRSVGHDATRQGSREVGTRARLPEEGAYEAVFVLAGDVESWRMDMSGPGYQVQNVVLGTPHRLRASDWTGPAQADFHAGAPAGSLAVLRSHSFSVDHSLLGWFFDGALAASAGEARLQGPTRDWTCPCRFPDESRIAPGSGDYTLHATGASVRALESPAFVYADVPLSRP